MNPISQLIDGLKIGLEDHVTLKPEGSVFEQRYIKRSQLMNLPDYLLVQEVRFVWREKDIGSNTDARKVKILRGITFPFTLDLFDLCSPELREKLLPVRKREVEFLKRQKVSLDEEYEDFKKKNFTDGEDNMKLYKKFKAKQALEQQEDFDNKLWRGLEKEGDTGSYELISVITHQGRSSDSGHYVSWIYDKGENWYKYDDDEVTRIKPEAIQNLKGGGDWPIAYFLVYKKKQFLPSDDK